MTELVNFVFHIMKISNFRHKLAFTRDVFYVRRKVDLMKTAKVNAYIMHIFERVSFYL